MRRAILICLVFLVALVAGCGGDDEPASESWADGFCSAAADWRSSLEDIVGQFQSPTDLNEDTVREAVDEGLDATESFVDDVEELGAPETEAGQEAAGIVDSMTSSIRATADNLRAALEESDSLGDLLSQVGQAAAQVGQLEQELESSLDELEQIETGELGADLQSNDDCAAARGSS